MAIAGADIGEDADIMPAALEREDRRQRRGDRQEMHLAAGLLRLHAEAYDLAFPIDLPPGQADAVVEPHAADEREPHEPVKGGAQLGKKRSLLHRAQDVLTLCRLPLKMRFPVWHLHLGTPALLRHVHDGAKHSEAAVHTAAC